MRDNLISTLKHLFPGHYDHDYESAADQIIGRYVMYVPVTRVAYDICKNGPAIEGHQIAVVTDIKPKQSESEKLQTELEPLP